MQQKYRVKLNEENTAANDQQKNGYLAYFGKQISLYTRGEAIKKGRVFGGKIELCKLSSVCTNMVMTQIPENAILHDIILHIDGKEAFRDNTKLDERIYHGDVFQRILNDNTTLIPKTAIQLEELASMFTESDYIQITK